MDGQAERAPLRRINLDDLRRLAAEGKTRRQAAAEMPASYDWLCVVAKRHGVVFTADVSATLNAHGGGTSPYWVRHDARLHELNARGFTAAAIGRLIGCTRNAVIGRLNRIKGYKVEMHPHTPRERTRDLFPGHGNCLFPLGDPGKDEFHFCGEPTADISKPYCASHCAKAYLPAPQNTKGNDFLLRN